MACIFIFFELNEKTWKPHHLFLQAGWKPSWSLSKLDQRIREQIAGQGQMSAVQAWLWLHHQHSEDNDPLWPYLLHSLSFQVLYVRLPAFRNRRVRCPMCLKLVKQLDTIDRLPINHTIFAHIVKKESEVLKAEGKNHPIKDASVFLFGEF